MKTKQVVDISDAPEDVKAAIYNRYRGISNDSYVEFFYRGDYKEDDLIYDWIESEGAKEPNGVLIKYWW